MDEAEVDLEPGGSWQHGATMGSNDDDITTLDFNDPYPVSPPPEPAPSRASRTCQVFEVEPDSELSEEEGEEEPGQDEDTYVWFLPDVGSEGDGDDGADRDDNGAIEDPRLARGENGRQLDVERDIDDRGTY